MLLGAWGDGDVDAVLAGPRWPAAADELGVTAAAPGYFAGYVLDLDGTVYLGDELLPGAAQTVAGSGRQARAWSS